MKRETRNGKEGKEQSIKQKEADTGQKAELAVSDVCWCNKDDSALRLLELGTRSDWRLGETGVDTEVSKRQPKRQLNERAEFHAGLFAPLPHQCQYYCILHFAYCAFFPLAIGTRPPLFKVTSRNNARADHFCW